MLSTKVYCWGFFAHGKINYYAVFLLPPEMMALYKPNISFLEIHATDPDKRRYAVKEEGPRHYIDIDHYGMYPFPLLPRKWNDAIAKFSKDSILEHGIVPWHIQVMLHRLTDAFIKKDFVSIMKNSAEIGHYISDAHVPLHTSSNHNGQLTNQRGIHGFWESRVPELLAEKKFDFFIGKADYISDPAGFIWKRILESAKASDSVLLFERDLTKIFPDDKKYAFEERNGKVVKQYSSSFTLAFNKKLNGMIERRMRQSVYAIASFWYTAWINAGQPNLQSLSKKTFNSEEIAAIDSLNEKWKKGSVILGREE
jgi:hypothetical protein